MPDVVGSAYVTIRAITSNLSKEIEKGVKKGVKDADVESSGGLIGDDLVKGASRKIKDGLGEAVGDATKNIDKKVDVDGGRRLGDRLGEGIKSGLSAALDSKAFSAISSRILKLIGLDESAGKKKGRGFGRGFLGAIAKFGVLFSPAILGLGSLLVQYVTALVSQVGLLAVAAAGAGVALGTVLGAAGLAAIPLVLAFKANTAQLARFKKVAEGVGKQFLEIGAATQETLLPGLTRALKLSRGLIPAFRGFGREIGRTAGFFAELAVGEFVRDQERLRTILQGSGRIFANLAGFARNFISIFLDLFKAAIPIGEQFSDALERMSDRWQNLIGDSADSGRLTATFQNWYDKAVLVGGALGDLFVALWNVLTVGSDSAVPFFDNFAVWAQGFRDFTESIAGQNRLKQIFDDANAVAHEFNGLIVEIARRIGTGVFEPGGNEGIISFIRVLREDVVPFLDTTFRQIMADVGPQLRELAAAFGDFLTKFAESGGLKASIELLGQFFVVLTKILSIPGMDKLLGALIAIAALGKVLKITGMAVILRGLGAVLTGAVIPAFLALSSIMPLIGTGFAAALSPFLLAAAVIAGVAAAVVLLVIHWDKVKAAFAATVRFFKDPMARLEVLKENIENLVGSLKELGGKVLGIVGRAFAKLGSIIKEKAEEAFTSFVEFLKDLPGKAVDALSKLGGGLLDAFTGAVTGLARELPGLLGKIILSFAALPFRIFFGLAGFSKDLLELFITALLGIGIWLGTDGIPAVLNFFQDLPGRIIGVLDTLDDTLRGLFEAAVQKVLDFFVAEGPSVLQFFKDLPGKVANFLQDLPGNVVDAFSTAFDAVTTAISTFITVTIPAFAIDMLTAGSRLIGALVEGLGKAISGTANIAKDIVNSVIGFINTEIIDKINDLLEFDIGGRFGVPKVHIDGPELGHIAPLAAKGGIFTRATNRIIGEAGAEVLIPLTNPQRALELFNQSGLAKVLEVAQRGRNSAAGLTATLNQPAFPGGVTSQPGRRPGGDLIIHDMHIEAPTPLETARQLSDRLRIMQSQLVSR